MKDQSGSPLGSSEQGTPPQAPTHGARVGQAGFTEHRTEPGATESSGVPAFGSRRFALPWDLSEWMSGDQLWQWTWEEVEGLNWDEPALVEYLHNRPDYHPRLLLALISYAYCLGVFEDGEVAELAFRGPPAAVIAGAQAPRSRDVKNFRTANRGLIKWVLVALFRRVLQAQFAWEGALVPAGLKRFLVRAATARLDLARTMIRATEEA